MTRCGNLPAAEVSQVAERVHRHDELIPENIIKQMAELGFFGMSVPEEYGGGGMGNLAMIITTEELSCASLGVAGSLITRPEILTKALLAWWNRSAEEEMATADCSRRIDGCDLGD